MMSLSVMFEGGECARRQTGELIGRRAVKRAVRAMRVVVVSKFRQPSPQVNPVLESASN